MWNPRNPDIEPARQEIESLNALLQLMCSNPKSMEHGQLEQLLGLALNLSCHLMLWFEAEENRRDE